MAAILLLCAETVQAGDRFPPIKPENMTAEQKQVADAIVAGPRKSLSGPFNAWLRSPELANRLQMVGEYLRFHSSVPARLNEFAILITAREWTSQFEWYAHQPLAIKAGLEPKVIADLAAGKRPEEMTEDEATIYNFCIELHRDKNVADKTFEAAIGLLGEQGVMDLIAVSGYYSLVSMTLNTAQVGLPAGEPW